MALFDTFCHTIIRQTNYFSIKNIEKIKKCVSIVTMSDESEKLSSHAKIAQQSQKSAKNGIITLYLYILYTHI